MIDIPLIVHTLSILSAYKDEPHFKLEYSNFFQRSISVDKFRYTLMEKAFSKFNGPAQRKEFILDYFVLLSNCLLKHYGVLDANRAFVEFIPKAVANRGVHIDETLLSQLSAVSDKMVNVVSRHCLRKGIMATVDLKSLIREEPEIEEVMKEQVILFEYVNKYLRTTGVAA